MRKNMLASLERKYVLIMAHLGKKSISTLLRQRLTAWLRVQSVILRCEVASCAKHTKSLHKTALKM